MKIIGKSNFDLETVSDILIAENVNPAYETQIMESLKNNTHEYDTYFPFLVEDNYKLYDASSIY